ncbi:hypothetical protein H072_1084 [Dactylellina haptotyla CBS 200.50]|uniref:Epoxide hydrolase N-terminal domain-containing protein n=1 Tax=Dactylellina haptotyla (strain CBS 200.50) TaxID=1284197 RepID=S8CB84_DACHA|nr:hypothetical protein H072_1084 [Dactylellina haptotyla CBS 200.50]
MTSSSDIQPFIINIGNEQLDHLQKKLDLTTFPDEILPEPDDWSQGPPLATMRRLVEYWRNGYDWKLAESKLNTFPQFITPIEIDGFGSLNVHFLHLNKGAKNAIPLIMIHGWPGTFYELTKVARILTEEGVNEPCFEIIVPSLIGYGFSDSAKKPGFTCVKQAEMCHKLMLKLGFEKYAAQGGDWGVVIAHIMANVYHPKHLRAIHINNSDIYEAPSFFKNPIYWLQNQLRGPYTTVEKTGIERTQKFLKEGFGYHLMHRHRPQTIGYSIQDSPSGLLAWILDKLHDWTDDYPWTDDEILTWISIFWFSTGGPTASVRLYYESARLPSDDKPKDTNWTSCPMGISYFPRDINVSPSAWARPMGNFVFERTHNAGGHFAAWETPDALAGDLKDMFRQGGAIYAAFT